MEIKVLGRGCAKCGLTEELIRQVLLEERIDARVEKITGFKEIAEHGVFLTPSVMIDGKVKCVGRIPRKEEVKAWVTKKWIKLNRAACYATTGRADKL